jgi:hypothetical protein
VDMAPYRFDVREGGPCRSCPGHWTADHAFACMNNGPARTARHEKCKGSVADFWRQTGYPVAEEYVLQEPDGGWAAAEGSDGEQQQPADGAGRRVDIRVDDQERNTVMLYDITFCSPRPLTHRRGGGHPDTPITREELVAKAAEIAAGKAATREKRGLAPQLQEESPAREAAIELLVGPVLVQAAERKKQKYAAAVNRQSLSNSQDTAAAVTFVPLVFSSAGTCTAAVSTMLRQLSSAVARRRRNDAGDLWAAPTRASIMRSVVSTISRLLVTSSAAFFSGARSLH